MQQQNPLDPQNDLIQTIKTAYSQKFILEQNNKAKLTEDYLFLKVMIGKYFIQSFRVFKMIPKDNSIILWKRQNNKTNYTLLIIVENINSFQQNIQVFSDQINDPVFKMKSSIQKMIKRPLSQYTVAMAFVKQMKKLNFSSIQNYKQFISSLKRDQKFQMLSKLLCFQPYSLSSITEVENNSLDGFDVKVQCFVPKLKKQNQELLFENQKDLDALKQLMTMYIDTFANQQKGGYLYKQIENSSISFSVDLLLNTINYILYEELNNSCYSQIQPCYWTCFESSTKKLNSDRKHITLTGNGQICVLQIIFMKDVQSENKIQYSMMLTQFKKFYKKAKIKIYRITNQKWNGQLQKINLQGQSSQHEQNQISGTPQIIYRFHSTIVHQYQAKQKQKEKQK